MSAGLNRSSGFTLPRGAAGLHDSSLVAQGALPCGVCAPACRAPRRQSGDLWARVSRRKQVLGTKVDAERDGVKVPTTLAEYCVKTKAPAPDEGSDLFYDDYYEDGEPEAEADSCFGDDEDDSGNEES